MPLSPEETKFSLGSSHQEVLAKDFEHAIETLSLGLLELDQLPLEEIGGKKLVDLCARLNAQYAGLDKILTPIKDRIKTQALSGMFSQGQRMSDDSIIVRGDIYQAVIQRIKKIVLDTPRIKIFLGTELHNFQKEQNEVHLKFGVKE